VLTELLINSNKYAYDGAAGPVEIELIADRTHPHLTVADKGVGRTSPWKGVGSRIIDALVMQLGGKFVLSDNRPGLRTTVTFPCRATGRSLRQRNGDVLARQADARTGSDFPIRTYGSTGRRP
jgi:two-component sensor histidine kinase